MRTWRSKSFAVIGSLALLTAACGDDDDSGGGGALDGLSGEEIIERVEADMVALSSMRMAGEITTGGETINIDLALASGGDCEGTIGMEGANAQIISVDGASYMKPDAAFWEQFAGPEASEQIAQQVGDNWVTMPGSDGDFSSFCDLDELLESFGEDDGDDGPEVSIEGNEERGGRDALKLVVTPADDDEPRTVWVSAEEPHVILEMQVEGGDDPGTMRFSDFDEPLDLEAPPEDEVVDLSGL